MRKLFGHAAVFAAFLLSAPAFAQDVTLTARDGGLTVSGTMQAFDGEFYRIDTDFGLLTVDAAGVLCEGPGCPDLTAPLSTIRIKGDADAGMRLLPELIAAFAAGREMTVQMTNDAGFRAELRARGADRATGIFDFTPAAPEPSLAALAEGRADLIIAAMPEEGLATRVLGMDALVPVAAPDNPLARIATADLARALSGDVPSWAMLGGPDMPLVVHALAADHSLQRALEARLGRPVVAGQRHPDQASLAAAVARDPYALAVIGRAATGPARMLALTDSCGFVLAPTDMAVKAGDYPLSQPIHLLVPRRRLPPMARDFLAFLRDPAAGIAVSAAGHVDRAPLRVPLATDGPRMVNAIRGAQGLAGLGRLKRLVRVMDGAERLSLTFRFTDGSTDLDAASQDYLADLAAMLDLGQLRGTDIILAGFTDGAGDDQTNLALSQDRANAVADALRAAATLADPPALRVEAFGEGLPMACDTTTAGRQLNRRVEVWLRPVTRPVTDNPRP